MVHGRRPFSSRPNMLGYVLVAPTIILIVGLSLIPMAYSLWLLVHSYNPLRPALTQFVGIGNLELLLQDPRVWHSLRTTVVYVGAAVPTSVVLGLLIALLFNNEYPGVRIFRGLALIPMMVMPVAVGLTFQMLFDYRIGVFNWIVADLLGLVRVQWLADPTMALVSVILMDVWQHTPFAMMVMLAGLRSMATDPVEAARVDGASPWQVFLHVILPYLRPLILVVVLLRLIAGFKLFDEVYALTQAGPGQATETLAYYVYVQGFKAFDLGYASAVSYVMLAVLAAISVVLIRRLENDDRG